MSQRKLSILFFLLFGLIISGCSKQSVEKDSSIESSNIQESQSSQIESSDSISEEVKSDDSGQTLGAKDNPYSINETAVFKNAVFYDSSLEVVTGDLSFTITNTTKEKISATIMLNNCDATSAVEVYLDTYLYDNQFNQLENDFFTTPNSSDFVTMQNDTSLNVEYDTTNLNIVPSYISVNMYDSSGGSTVFWFNL